MSEPKLRPTLWRTCRALMNPVRLNMMRIAFATNGELCVRDFAKALELPDAIASIYLRQLNARGLLGVARDRIKVYYNTSQNRSLPDSIALQEALKAYFAGPMPDNWETEVMTTLRAFTHFNRLAILERLARGPADFSELREAMGVCVKSVYHHLGFLSAAGLIEERPVYRRPSVFFLRRPVHPLAKVLLGLLVRGDIVYYNPGSGRDEDTASRAIYRKIRRAEGVTRTTYQATGPKVPRKGRLTPAEKDALKEDEA